MTVCRVLTSVLFPRGTILFVIVHGTRFVYNIITIIIIIICIFGKWSFFQPYRYVLYLSACYNDAITLYIHTLTHTEYCTSCIIRARYARHRDDDDDDDYDDDDDDAEPINMAWKIYNILTSSGNGRVNVITVRIALV